MSFGISALFFLLFFLLNIIVTTSLIKKHSNRDKIISELHNEVKNLINDIDNHILLADDAKNQLRILLKQASKKGVRIPMPAGNPASSKTSGNDTDSVITKATEIIPASQITKKHSDISENIAQIAFLIEQGKTDAFIMTTLNVSKEEINLVSTLKNTNRK